MMTERLARGFLAVLTIGVLCTPYAGPLLCEVSDHGDMAMAHMDQPANAVQSVTDDPGGGCHDSMGCLAPVIAVPAQEQVPRRTAGHAEALPIPPSSASVNPTPPLTPPPRA